MNHWEHWEHRENFGKRESSWQKACSMSILEITVIILNIRFKRGYLLNFNVKLLKEGIKRVSI
jgi:hypothetical protein